VKEKGVSSIVVLFLLLFCAVLLSVLIVPRVSPNPIPINTNLLLLQSEDIKINVIPDNGGYTAQVIGVYPFRLSGRAFKWEDEWWDETGENLEEILKKLEGEARGEMMMLFPVPANSENILVELFDENIEWKWADNEYATELGNFPMLKWTFRIPENIITTTIHGEREASVTSDIFTLVVRYTHLIPLENDRHVILYALGTGRYLGAYNWWKSDAPAHIETKLPEEVENVGARLTKFEPYNPPEFTIDEENNRVTATCLLGHDTGDYVVEFTLPENLVENIQPSVQALISDISKSGSPGESITYLVTVKNMGTSTDTFNLQATDTEGWGSTVSVPSFTLDAGASRTGIKLTIKIPDNAAEGDSTTITVTTTSQAYSAVENSTTCTAMARAEEGGLPLVYIGVAVVIVVIIVAVLITKPF